MTREEYLARRRELMAQAESQIEAAETVAACLLYTSPSPRD